MNYSIDSANDPVNIFVYQSLVLNLNWCECSSYSMTKIDDISRTFKQPGESKFTLPLPDCDDQHAKTVIGCTIINDWVSEIKPKDQSKVLPTEFTKSGYEVTVKSP